MIAREPHQHTCKLSRGDYREAHIGWNWVPATTFIGTCNVLPAMF